MTLIRSDSSSSAFGFFLIHSNGRKRITRIIIMHYCKVHESDPRPSKASLSRKCYMPTLFFHLIRKWKTRRKNCKKKIVFNIINFSPLMLPRMFFLFFSFTFWKSIKSERGLFLERPALFLNFIIFIWGFGLKLDDCETSVVLWYVGLNDSDRRYVTPVVWFCIVCFGWRWRERASIAFQYKFHLRFRYLN